MTNFASLDPTLKQRGMSNHSRLDATVWSEFFNNMDDFFGANVAAPELVGTGEEAAVFRHRDGVDVMRLGKTRVNQDFFRSLILASYDNKCALTGINSPALLVASHIVPWSVDEKMRTNPTNGICLNALHDKAFDLGLMTFDTDLTVRYSPKLPALTKKALAEFGANKLRLPSRFVPDEAMLAYHRSYVFIAG
jgi:putative restriction endonuclease